MSASQTQTELTKNEFIKKFNGLTIPERKELLKKAGATDEQLTEGFDCIASEIVENLNDGQELLCDCWTVLNEELNN